jgi:hypothetical protein
MTRDEFINGVDTWYDLREFCDEHGCSICEDIIDDDDRDDEIDSDVEDAIRNDRWYDIKGYLEDIPTGYSYYRRDGRFDYVGMDDNDFEEYKSDVLEWADNEGDIWETDPEDEDEDYDVFEAELEADAAASAAAAEEEPGPEAEDFSVGDLMGMCCVAFVTIKEADAQRVQEEEQNLQQLYPKVLK